MADILNWFLWLVPILIIPASYVSFRFIPLRAVRYWAAVPLFLGAFVLNLFRVSFHNDLIDVIGCLVLTFFIFEWIWHWSKSKRKIWLRLGLIVGAASLVYGYFDWLAAGPRGVHQFYSPTIITNTPESTSGHYVKDRRIDSPVRTIRLISIRRALPHFALERDLDFWEVPGSYAKTAFSFKWGVEKLGPKVDLIDVSSVIWTIGEGL